MIALTALGGFAILLSISILKIIHFYTVKLWHFRYSLEAKADRSSGGTATFSSYNRLDTTPLTNTVSEVWGGFGSHPRQPIYSTVACKIALHVYTHFLSQTQLPRSR